MNRPGESGLRTCRGDSVTSEADLAYHARRFVPACRSLAHSPLERRHPIVSAQQEMIDSSDENGVWM